MSKSLLPSEAYLGRWQARSVTEEGRDFDPQRLTSDASLQRVVIGALPGASADIAARPASDVCSRDALARLVLDTRGLPAPEHDRLGDQLTELRSSPDAATRKLAGQVLRAYGSRLGALLATLKHPATPTQQGGTPVRRAYFEHWLGIERVWLGGGLLTSAGAEDILAGTQQLLSRAGTVLELRVAQWPRLLPLLGAARLCEPHDGRALVADARHSTIKTAWPSSTAECWPRSRHWGRDPHPATAVDAPRRPALWPPSSLPPAHSGAGRNASTVWS